MKDKTLIPIALALYIGLLLFTGTATRVAIGMRERINAGFSMLSTPLGVFVLLSATGTGIIYWVRRRAK